MSLAPSTQARILGLVSSNPGIHKSLVQERLGIGWGTVHFHTERLLEAGTLCARRIGARVHLFPPVMADAQIERTLALCQDHSRSIVAALAMAPGANVSELARTLGAARRTIRGRLDALLDVGIVEATPTPIPRYRLTPRASPRPKRTDHIPEPLGKPTRPISPA